jgi:hypothetical protein
MVAAEAPPAGPGALSFGFRASHVSLARPEDDGSPNVWRATLSGVNFLGTHMHFIATIGRNTIVYGAVPEHAWDRALIDGSDCYVHVSPDRIHVLPE